jgi:glycosyltransferase involved in cell wall biosynthesis
MVRISVIITAHDRKEYILQAVDSVLISNIAKDKYEILVIKNFIDKSLDRILEDKGVTTILEQKIPLSAKQKTGITNASGDYIAFLEDDDLFHPLKLGEVYKILERSDNLNYYYNDNCYIDENFNSLLLNKITLSRYYKMLENDPIIIFNTKGKNKNLFKFKPYAFNSNIVISKRLGIKYIHLLDKLNMGTEFFWFAVALSEEGKIAIDKRPLTFYRLHRKSASQIEVINEIERYNFLSKQTYANLFSIRNNFVGISNDFINSTLLFIKTQSIISSNKRQLRDSVFTSLRLINYLINPNSLYKKYGAYLLINLLFHIINPIYGIKMFIKNIASYKRNKETKSCENYLSDF